MNDLPRLRIYLQHIPHKATYSSYRYEMYEIIHITYPFPCQHVDFPIRNYLIRRWVSSQNQQGGEKTRCLTNDKCIKFACSHTWVADEMLYINCNFFSRDFSRSNWSKFSFQENAWLLLGKKRLLVNFRYTQSIKIGLLSIWLTSNDMVNFCIDLDYDVYFPPKLSYLKIWKIKENKFHYFGIIVRIRWIRWNFDKLKCDVLP